MAAISGARFDSAHRNCESENKNQCSNYRKGPVREIHQRLAFPTSEHIADATNRRVNAMAAGPPGIKAEVMSAYISHWPCSLVALPSATSRRMISARAAAVAKKKPPAAMQPADNVPSVVTAAPQAAWATMAAATTASAEEFKGSDNHSSPNETNRSASRLPFSPSS